jgi:hypothetical protein
MAIADRLPDLSDKELETLQTNAVRLKETGSVQQRRQAEGLLPLLDAALEERRLVRVATQAETRARAPKKKKAETP